MTQNTFDNEKQKQIGNVVRIDAVFFLSLL